MPHAKLERWSLRAALALGFCVTLGLWLFTDYAFTQRIDTVRNQAEQVAARYNRVQELLSAVRSQVLLSSIRARDALLETDPDAIPRHREAIEASATTMSELLRDYPEIGLTDERQRIEALRQEVERFHQVSLQIVSGNTGRSPQQVREVLNCPS